MVTFRRLTAFVTYIGAALALVACNQLGDINKATLRDCVVVSDCTIEVPECRTAVACNDGRCIFENAPDGKPLAQQSIGDCTEIVCDGAGGIKSRDTPADIMDEGDPCTIDECVEGKARHRVADEVPCYQGPAWTRNVGICAGGIQKCVNGRPDDAGCEGQVLPKVEYCDEFMEDEDCDGRANNEGAIGCVCKPGEIVDCYSGTAGTENMSICHGGMKSCNDDGRGYGPCIGEQAPMPETCDSVGIDDDCDGLVDEAGAGCFCGDGYVSADIEDCDDGNFEAWDYCTASCRVSKCGDGIVHAVLGELCDDGNLDSTDSCTSQCRPALCGDGITQPSNGEACDDGNFDSTDGCTPFCQRAACGDGFVQPNEYCDDGNTVDGDDCPSRCRPGIVMVSAGFGQTCVVFSDGTLKCWGSPPSRGIPEFVGMGKSLPRVNVGPGKTVKAVSAGSEHTCAILNDDTVKCWGINDYGQLGLGDSNARGWVAADMGDNLPTVDLGAGKTAKAISAGQRHTCAILNDDTVKCWGQNDGRLGLGDSDNRGDDANEMGDALPTVNLGLSKTAKAISASDLHTCAILNDNSVKCWGHNESGQLGLGDDVTRGDNPGEMGDVLPIVDLGTGKSATTIATRGEHTCAILDDHRLKCWGLNNTNQLGRSCYAMPCSIGNESGEMGDALPAIDLGSDNPALVSVAVGSNHTCALLQNGRLKCWGYSYYGQTGYGNTMLIGFDATMGDVLPPVKLGTGTVLNSFASGKDHNCAVLDGDTLKCWGSSAAIGLSAGKLDPIGDEPGEMGDLLPVELLW